MSDSNASIIRFEPHGPAETGLAVWDPIDPSELESGEPVQRGHIYHQDESAGYMAGVWDCTAMTGKFEPYSVHEFMFLLEGSVTMELGDGSRTTINAGEAFFIPKGLPCKWIQPGYVRKYFMIWENPGVEAVAHDTSQGLVLPKREGPAGGLVKDTDGAPSSLVGAEPELLNHTYYEDASGQFIVGVWDATPFTCTPEPFGRNELMVLLEGEVTLTDEAGNEHHFVKGDAAYVMNGAVMGWSNPKQVRKFYSIHETK